MCNLYSMTAAPEAIRRLFGVTGGATPNVPPLERIRPTDRVPVVRQASDGNRELALMRWGFVLPQGDKAPKPVTNARSDKVNVSPFWKPSFESRRCLVPVTAFGEWTEAAPKILHWFRLKGAEEGLFAFAGLWRPWQGALRGETVSLETMAFLTTAPNAEMAPIHSKSMPVILTQDQYDVWLNGTAQEALRLARPLADGLLEVEKAG
ncbi:SOS response-associated peptidase [Pedomonas sp. V897]|uniref:SOS response-associated peptidase n=1 Tax=Pedomonas sp. V897 TaxID=3446482 RepID=UPI003EDF101E